MDAGQRQGQDEQVGHHAGDAEDEEKQALVTTVTQGDGRVKVPLVADVGAANGDLGDEEGRGPYDNDPDGNVHDPTDAVPDAEYAAEEAEEGELDAGDGDDLDDGHGGVDLSARHDPPHLFLGGQNGAIGAVVYLVQLDSGAGAHGDDAGHGEGVIDTDRCAGLEACPEAEEQEYDGRRHEDNVDRHYRRGRVVGHGDLCYLGCCTVSRAHLWLWPSLFGCWYVNVDSQPPRKPSGQEVVPQAMELSRRLSVSWLATSAGERT